MAYRILIVDDEPALQQMLGEILAQAGYRTDSALSCAQALEQFRAAPPDAVLLDVISSPRNCCCGCGRYSGGSTGISLKPTVWEIPKSTGAKAPSAGMAPRLLSLPKSSPC